MPDALSIVIVVKDNNKIFLGGFLFLFLFIISRFVYPDLYSNGMDQFASTISPLLYYSYKCLLGLILGGTNTDVTPHFSLLCVSLYNTTLILQVVAFFSPLLIVFY